MSHTSDKAEFLSDTVTSYQHGILRTMSEFHQKVDCTVHYFLGESITRNVLGNTVYSQQEGRGFIQWVVQGCVVNSVYSGYRLGKLATLKCT